MATCLEIIQGLSQVMANAHDGATNEDGTKKEAGLKREEEVEIKDKRVIDGFSIKMHGGNKLCIIYTTQVLVDDLLDSKGKYEDMLMQDVSDLASFLKKEFKKVTGQTLGLKEIKETEPVIEVLQTSRIRTEVKLMVDYEIGGLEDSFEEKDSYREKNMKGMEKWLSLVNDKKPENDTRKPEKEDK